MKKDEKKLQKIREKNSSTLLSYCDLIFNRIKASFLFCPANFRKIFTHIRKIVMERFPNHDLVLFTAPSGFIWLRFFCPSLLSPRNFGLLEDNITTSLSRDLMLCAKVIQNLANFLQFGKKEPFMEICNSWVMGKTEEMKEFLNTLCSLPTEPIDEIPAKRDALNWGREMARLHFSFARSLRKIN